MGKRNKLWKSISVIGLAGAAGMSLSACTEEENEGEAAVAPIETSVDAVALAGEGEGEGEVISAGEGEGEGEVVAAGEGEGEGEGAAATELTSDDLAYLTHLSLIKGHLYVGAELYKAGHIEHAKTHMKHPESELYADLVPALEARGTAGFAKELTAVSDAVNEEKGVEAVQTALDTLLAAIDTNAMAVSETSATPAEKLKLVVQLLRTAADEYAIAVVDGKMENAHEYQDAFGFTTIATDLVEGIESDESAVTDAKAATLAILADVKPHWPGLIPPETLKTEAGALYGAAAQIELLALGL